MPDYLHKKYREENGGPPVRPMVCDVLTRTFGTYKEDRHLLQKTISELVGKVLWHASKPWTALDF